MVEKTNKNSFLLRPGSSRSKKIILGAVGLIALVGTSSVFLWGKYFIQLERLFEKPKSILLTVPKGTNLQLESSGRKLVVSAGEFVWHGTKCSFDKANKIDIPPCPRIEIRLPLLDGKNLPIYKNTEDRWQSAIRRATIKCSPQYFIKEVLVPGSVHLENAADFTKDASAKPSRIVTNLLWVTGAETFYGPDNMILINRRDRDFTLASVFEITKDLSLNKHSTAVLYEAKTRRIDTLCLNKLGKMELVSGGCAEFAPAPPLLPDGFVPLANIMAPTEKADLANSDICPTQKENPIKIEDALKTENYSALEKMRKKLESGTPVKILFYGDSITCGGSVMDPSKSFPEVFTKELGDRYLHARITMINKGVGETSCKTRYRRFSGEVLSEKPDLVVIEFVNDYQLPPETIGKAYNSILSVAKAAGVEVIFCTPHLLNPLVFGYSTWDQVAHHPYIAQIRALAKKHDIALCDVSSRWLHMPEEGVLPEWLLTDKAIHINELGHKIYAQELLKCFH